MKKLPFVLALLPMWVAAQSIATQLLTMTEITVKPGHNTQFMEGVKMWKNCYLQNKGMDKWNMWHREQGEENVYVMTAFMDKWADMDKKDEAGDLCSKIVTDFIWPHIEKIDRNMAETLPEISREGSPDTKVVWVTYAEVNNGTDFNNAIKSITSAIKKQEGSNRVSRYDVMGRAPETPDYFVAIPFTGYAAMDINQDRPWEVLEKVQGKKSADATGASFRSSVDKIWSYIFKLIEDLSYR